MDCGIIREALQKPALSSDDCRLLVDRNRDLINEIADPKFERGDYRAGEKNLHVMEVTGEDFAKIASRFSTSVLDLAAGYRWGG